MPASPRKLDSPWPLPTPVPVPAPSATKHRKRRDRQAQVDTSDYSSLALRDVDEIITDAQAVKEAMRQCELFSGNNIFSCFPNSDTVIPQHQFASFVWNSLLPQFTQTEKVNIYLLSATNQNVLLQWHDVENPTNNAGLIHAEVNDTWWGDRGALWNGGNQTFLFYFVVTRNDVPLDASALPQATFTAVQTTVADFVAASISSASASASAASASIASALSASAASEISASLASLSSAAAAATTTVTDPAAGGSSNGTTNGTNASGTRSGSGIAPSATSSDGVGNVQSSSSSPFPHWAIAVIVVLGFLALLAGGILTFVILRRLRRTRNSRLSHRGSMGSSTPMMANAREPQSPVTGAGSFAGGVAAPLRPRSPDNDGVSTMSHGSEAAPFSGADAAVMADAFRAALRKPNFADRPVEEGESPESDPTGPAVPRAGDMIMGRELAEEGRDIRSVDSSRGVTVQSMSQGTADDSL